MLEAKPIRLNNPQNPEVLFETRSLLPLIGLLCVAQANDDLLNCFSLSDVGGLQGVEEICKDFEM